MRILRRVLFMGGVAAGVTALAFAIARRADEAGLTPGRYIRRALKGFVTHRFDPIILRLGLAGGRRSWWGVIEHVGRVTRKIHHTPVAPKVVEANVYIPLPYGTDAQWVRNVQAAGHCRMQYRERLYELDEPRIVGLGAVEGMSEAARDAAERLGFRYLELHRLADAPGTFSHTPEGIVIPVEPEWRIPEAPVTEEAVAEETVAIEHEQPDAAKPKRRPGRKVAMDEPVSEDIPGKEDAETATS